MRETGTPDPESGYVPDRDGLRALPAKFIAGRLLTLKARAEGVVRVRCPGKGWVFATVTAAHDLPSWSVSLMGHCSPRCAELACGGDHHLLTGAWHCPSSLSAFRRFRSKVRALYQLHGEVTARATEPFRRSAEDRSQ